MRWFRRKKPDEEPWTGLVEVDPVPPWQREGFKGYSIYGTLTEARDLSWRDRLEFKLDDLRCSIGRMYKMVVGYPLAIQHHINPCSPGSELWHLWNLRGDAWGQLELVRRTDEGIETEAIIYADEMFTYDPSAVTAMVDELHRRLESETFMGARIEYMVRDVDDGTDIGHWPTILDVPEELKEEED